MPVPVINLGELYEQAERIQSARQQREAEALTLETKALTLADIKAQQEALARQGGGSLVEYYRKDLEKKEREAERREMINRIEVLNKATEIFKNSYPIVGIEEANKMLKEVGIENTLGRDVEFRPEIDKSLTIKATATDDMSITMIDGTQQTIPQGAIYTIKKDKKGEIIDIEIEEPLKLTPLQKERLKIEKEEVAARKEEIATRREEIAARRREIELERKEVEKGKLTSPKILLPAEHLSNQMNAIAKNINTYLEDPTAFPDISVVFPPYKDIITMINNTKINDEIRDIYKNRIKRWYNAVGLPTEEELLLEPKGKITGKTKKELKAIWGK